MNRLAIAGAALAAIGLPALLANGASLDSGMPRYDNVVVIVEENKDYGSILGSPDAPALNDYAHKYGYATHYYAVSHPSEPNYVAMAGGSTYGIRDDDAFYCTPRDLRPHCAGSGEVGYPDHTIAKPDVTSQLEAAGLTWKDYNESLPAAGSLAIVAPDPHAKDVPPTLNVYASKHSGFLNFASVQNDPNRASKIVDFGQLHRDLASGNLPNFSFIVPNLCNDMHGADAAGTPDDCSEMQQGKLIGRGDRNLREIVSAITSTPLWQSSKNVAIVVTFDEDGHDGNEGCCGTDQSDPANAGGGHILTIVMTNHGPRGAVDDTPYSHYSLLRTVEDAFGIGTHLGQASAPGVVPMSKLFVVTTAHA